MLQREFWIITFTIGFFLSCTKNEEEPLNVLAGGKTTVFVENSNSFQFPAPNLTIEELEQHRLGDQAFEAIFVTAPSTNNSGLGPLFNQSACGSCHPKNGRSVFSENPGDLAGLLFRLSITGKGPHGEPLAVPGFGGQLQTKANLGKLAEANVDYHFKYVNGTFADGELYELRQAIFSLTNSYIPIPGGTLISPRMAPPVFGLGLLEFISESEILKNEDIQDSNGDGISGKANWVWDVQKSSIQLGRFGWKAGQPDLVQQAAAAYNEDMGVTNPLFKSESSTGQLQQDSLKDDPEIDQELLEQTAFYTRSLAVPAPRNQSDPTIQNGKRLFIKIGCEKCHLSSFKTGVSPFLFLSNQSIQPYTDLLLHDMGDALSDGRPDFNASGNEWRTPPLWGIGLTLLVNGHTHFLHDGRARNLQEAILWHEGEAKSSRDQFKKLNKSERSAILKFILSL